MAEIDELLEIAEQAEASDLFVFSSKVPHLKIRGRTLPIEEQPVVKQSVLSKFIKKLPKTVRQRYNKSGQVDLGWSTQSGCRFRLNLHRQSGKPALVARKLPSGELQLKELGLPSFLAELTTLSRGLVLVTGAAGSGKSTAMAALLHRIHQQREAHIVTIEDPIEFVYGEGKAVVSQREIGSDAESYSDALHNVLRQSPDVIMIGEIRDLETMEVAISAALTGHLVLATLHTIGAVQTLQRILSFFPDSRHSQVLMDLSLSLKAVLSLRLLPHVDGSRRVPAIELLTVTPGIARLLQEGRHHEIPEALKASSDERLTTFAESLLNLYEDGAITLDMGAAYSDDPEAFRLAAKGMTTTLGGISPLEGEFRANYDMRTLLSKAVEQGASDLHLTVDRPPMVRILGELRPLHRDPLSPGEVRWLLFSILNSRQRSAFELEHELDFSLSLGSGERFRVNAYYQKGYVAVAMRTIPSHIPAPEELGLPSSVLQLADKHQGLVLMVGPTGVGKSTTVACLVDRINKTRPCHILTVEDPIEYHHVSKVATVDQREVYSDTASFSSALKYVLRQDPDVIVVGEMRDLETISAVLTAAETGHLVFATLHTNDVTQTVDRIVDVFPPHQQSQIRLQLAACLLGVVSQRLLPRADGRGRVAAFEVMLATSAIRALVRDGKTHQLMNIVSTGSSQGMLTLDRSLAQLVEEGLVSHEEAGKYMDNPRMIGMVDRDTADEHRARQMLEDMGHMAKPSRKEGGGGFFNVFKNK